MCYIHLSNLTATLNRLRKGRRDPPREGISPISGSKYPQLLFENHAVRRMAERGVTPDQVQKVLESPDWTAPASRPGATKYVKKIGGRKLTVIGEAAAAFTRIVSVFWEDLND